MLRDAATIGSSLALTLSTLPRTTMAECSAHFPLSGCPYSMVSAVATRSVARNSGISFEQDWRARLVLQARGNWHGKLSMVPPTQSWESGGQTRAE